MPLLYARGLEVDEDALRSLMERANISDHDVLDPKVFGTADALVARSFAQFVRADPNHTRADLYGALGMGTGRLLRGAVRPLDTCSRHAAVDKITEAWRVDDESVAI